MPTLHALLVGINGYPVKPLQGCINDVNAVKKYLIDSTTAVGIPLKLKILTDNEEVKPTRDNLISSFACFKDAEDDDVCLFYYSGHGSFSPAPPEFWTETDGLNESLVCIDSRQSGGRDLMDKELSVLIWQAMIGKPNVTFVVITDCCHSGTITKNIFDSDVVERMASPNTIPQTFNEYYGYDLIIEGQHAFEKSVGQSGREQYNVARGRHIHLGASRDHQTSKELKIEGEQRGVFTYSLIKELTRCEGRISYRELIDLARISVKHLVSDQDPTLNIDGGLSQLDENKIFLTDSFLKSDGKRLVYHSTQDNQWYLKGGKFHGIRKGDKILIDGIGETKVIADPTPDESLIEAIEGMVTVQPYSAIVKRAQARPIKIGLHFSIPQKIKELLLDTERMMQPDQFAFTEFDGQYIVGYKNGTIALFAKGSEKPIFKPLLLDIDAQRIQFIGQIERFCKWIHLLELQNTTTVITNNDYLISLYLSPTNSRSAVDFIEQQDLAAITDLHYKFINQTWTQPSIMVKIKNMSNVTLFFSPVYLSMNFGIQGTLLNQLELKPGKEAWLTWNKGMRQVEVIPLIIEKKEYLDLGYNSIIEYIKILISTSPIKTSDIDQPGIELPNLLTKNLKSKSTAKRGISCEVVELADSQVEWKTETIGLRITRPLDIVEIGPHKETQIAGIVIEGHELVAKVNLSSSSLTSKVADSILPPHQANHNSALVPIDLAGGTTRTEVVMDVIELQDVKNIDSVSPQNPLKIRLSEVENSDESILPIGYNAETGLYFPLGYFHDGKVIIETLSSETPTDATITKKSFLGSIKIYFQKVIGKKIGLRFNYPRLAIPTVVDGNVEYNNDVPTIAAKVKEATSIAVFVHGIIGDTEGMAQSAAMVFSEFGSINKQFGLVLTFDYENLDTSIEDNGSMLGEKLADVGLAPGHGKELIIIAHSMGGLVSRWFIEQKKGNKVVSKLFMLGTPNNGSAWSDVRDMAESLITMAINGVAFLKPWTLAISLFGKAVRGTQNSLKQMHSDSPFYKALNNGTDPKIPYIVVAGNTQLISPKIDDTATKLMKLFTIVRKRGAYLALDTLIFKNPNDIAVTVRSIEQLDSSTWKKKPEIYYVACDHLNYFNNEEAMRIVLSSK
ncbi:caspase family protein [Xanthocytophaga agilis]|uniref:Caspase family protein n=1 Tax=Xanthocytophaga agilis TaxID=3048010 RepID=A0AAE3R7M7_9BACT|nr:caspase family protein [Xanthocytophaga agilis]MDJ1505161.1 caspase family protein [Xanthocytophaga agilis]